MYNIRIIGDVHGKLNQYFKATKSNSPNLKTIQVGDFGFKSHHDWHIKNIDNKIHKVLFGNHDYYPYLDCPHSLGDFGMYNEDIFFVRGAFSIDQHQRIDGVDYFENEELSYLEMGNAIDLYVTKKPSVVISHDCPQSIRENIFNIFDKCITSNGLQSMLDEHKPKLWIFGHHHKSIDITIDGTRFICLKELETIDI